MPGSARLYHLAVATEWSDAVAAGGPYRRSTLGRSLEEVGFIHCAHADQVQGVADRYYRGRDDIVLLTIDRAKVDAEVRVEANAGGDEQFPHLYGPLALGAVVDVTPVRLGPDGRLTPSVEP